MNNIFIKGRLTANPELKKSASGKSVTTISVAVDSGYGDNKKADFFTVVAWEKQAELIAHHFTKGQEIIIGGEMHSRDYTTRDGNRRTVWEVTARLVEFCGTKGAAMQTPEDRTAPQRTAEQAPPAFTTGDLDDFAPVMTDDGDLPF